MVGLTLMVLGVVWLEAAAPQVDVQDRRVDGVPALALAEARSCTRQADDTVTDDIRTAFPSGGRVSSTQVFACPSAFDGRRVTYVGEAIGDLLVRRDGAWLQVNDDVYALEVGPLVGHREQGGFNTGMSVWLPDGLHERVQGLGRPDQRGDVILVRGTLHRADPNDGGGTTVRAEELEILAEALPIDDPLHVPQLIVAIVLAVLALASVLWSRRSARRA